MADRLVLKMTHFWVVTSPEHTSHLLGGVEHALQSRKADQYNPKKDQVDNLQCQEKTNNAAVLQIDAKLDPT